MTDLERIAAAADEPIRRAPERRRQRHSALPGIWILFVFVAALAGFAAIMRARPDLYGSILDDLGISVIQLLAAIIGVMIVFWVIYAAVRAAIRDAGR